MPEIQLTLLYVTLFISLFFEVFLLITYFEIREEIEYENQHGGKNLKRFPTTTVIVPCYNEEKTIRATVESILALDYPKDRLKIILVDDGSKDGTLVVLQSYEGHQQIRILTKENGGKHSALNLALKEVDTEIVGCLDADSFVNTDALRKLVAHFDDEKIMAVTPAIKIHEPKTVMQHIQKTEYSWGILFRRILASLGALYVTPGPFSFFRTHILKGVGGYKHAHNTEDLEIALRFQKYRYKIANSHGAHVYTVAPANFYSLYKQRVRWTYGFLNNAFDYRQMFFNRKYGHIGLMVLPIATVSLFTVLFATMSLVGSWVSSGFDTLTRYETVGFQWKFPSLSFDWFFLNTGTLSLLATVTVVLTIFILYLSLKIADGKARLDRGVIFYMTIYRLLAPIWIIKAIWNTITRRQVEWR